MVSDVKLGCFLSGGLDSSTIVNYAKQIDPSVECFTIRTKGGVETNTVDDLPYARKVANHLNLSFDRGRGGFDNLISDLLSMVKTLEEPIADPACLNVLYISRAARQMGIKVMLSGAGADDVLTGYRRHTALYFSRYWKMIPLAVRKILVDQIAMKFLDFDKSRKFLKFASGSNLEGHEKLIDFFKWTNAKDLKSLFCPELDTLMSEKNIQLDMEKYLEGLPSGLSELQKLLFLEQRFFSPDHNLLYTDKMSMAAGVEVRVPFLDLELVDLITRYLISINKKVFTESGF